MIKRIFIWFTLGTFLLPVAGPLLGHDYIHAMHAAHESHHLKRSHEHHTHDHPIPETTIAHHNFDINFVAFLNDYIHDELPNFSKKAVRHTDIPLYKRISNKIPSDEYDPRIIRLSFHEKPVALQRNDLYLTTQRLRIGV